ncbi:hypothetical protein RRG08_001362 [Elysia crispata]|uniref:Uncharacterized protein n=1 Tax=Elysia crispata TaxID=231223 RepID=A0AAE1AWU1_9GAST|nr:hypothetical protein RRG08_001362 [Elysia crispata]
MPQEIGKTIEEVTSSTFEIIDVEEKKPIEPTIETHEETIKLSLEDRKSSKRLKRFQTSTAEETVEAQADQPRKTQLRKNERNCVGGEESSARDWETIEEASPATFDETLEVDVEKATKEVVETEQETITVDFGKPKRWKLSPEVVDLPAAEELLDVESEKQEEETEETSLEEDSKIIVVDLEKPLDTEETRR